MRPLDGRVALVTGASQGIGQGIALELGGRGATVWLTARSAAGLEKTADQIRELGGAAVTRPCNHVDVALQKAPETPLVIAPSARSTGRRCRRVHHPMPLRTR